MPTDGRRLIPLGDAAGDEVTVYVKGFLASGEEPLHFDRWHRGHQRLVESQGWGEHAHGWAWDSGSWLSIPVPMASGTKLAWDVYRAARHARVAALGATAGMAVAEVAARFASQYWMASRRAAEDAEALARELRDLAERHTRVRVVAHSLGCRQVVAAAASLAPELRPAEVHLCGPALVEDDVADVLGSLARDRTYVYYAENDLVLRVAFPIVAFDRALGAGAPKGTYDRLQAIDVGHHFGFFVHAEYKNRFSEFAATPVPA